MTRLGALALILAAAGCTTAHIQDPHHTWTPLHDRTARTWADLADDDPQKEIYLGFGYLVDGICFPFHWLGHVFHRA